MKILIIEDDSKTADFVATGLQALGHVTRIAENGRQGFEVAAAETFDVVVLDRILPRLDGISVAAPLRSEGIPTLVLFLTSVSGVDDRVEGLGAGGDDNLVKPLAFKELLARLEALARRPTLGSTPTVLTAGDLEMDLVAHCAPRRLGHLQPREFRLLEVLMRSEGKLITRKMLLEQVWGFHFDPGRTSSKPISAA
jgi:two-component system, OmpR family, response regulator